MLRCGWDFFGGECRPQGRGTRSPTCSGPWGSAPPSGAEPSPAVGVGVGWGWRSGSDPQRGNAGRTNLPLPSANTHGHLVTPLILAVWVKKKGVFGASRIKKIPPLSLGDKSFLPTPGTVDLRWVFFQKGGKIIIYNSSYLVILFQGLWRRRLPGGEEIKPKIAHAHAKPEEQLVISPLKFRGRGSRPPSGVTPQEHKSNEFLHFPLISSHPR